MFSINLYTYINVFSIHDNIFLTLEIFCGKNMGPKIYLSIPDNNKKVIGGTFTAVLYSVLGSCVLSLRPG